MEVLILDIFPDVPYRISKDTNGGFGTAYKLGSSIFGRLLAKKIKDKVNTLQPSISYLLAGLESSGIDVRYQRCFSVPNLHNTPDIFLVNSSIVCWEAELNLCLELVKRYPQSKVFLFGPFASTQANVIPDGIGLLKGEVEQMVLKPSILTELEKGECFNLGFVEDLDALPLPIPSGRTFELGRLPFLRGAVAPILAKRGCPYSCSYYCTYPLQQGKKIRKHSVDYIVRLIKTYRDRGVKSFIFRDPVFTIDKKWVEEFCDCIVAEKIKITFCAEFHLKDLNDRLIEKLRMAGLKLCYVGIESSDKDVLSDVKRQDLMHDIQFENVRKLEEAGVVCKAMYILGLPGENEEKARGTIDFSLKIPSTLAQYSVFTPYPGTPAFNDYEITANRFMQFTQWDLVYKTNLSNESVQFLVDESSKRFYFRPITWLRVLRHVLV